MPTVETTRLALTRPTQDDAEQLYRIASDARVWGHFPSGRHTDILQTRAVIDVWLQSWNRVGLGSWVVHLRETFQVIGYGGCSLLADTVWNLGYRLAADEHGKGYATELAREAVRQAGLVRPELPVIAYLLEHNAASARVAEKLGFELVYRGPDAGNPDPKAVRLVYASRALTAEELAVVVR